MEIRRLRAAVFDDLPALIALARAQDRAWWGREETEADEVEQRLRLAGDLTAHTRVVETAAGPVAYAVRFGANDTDVILAPDLATALRRRVEDELLGWLVTAGVERLEAPAQDTDLLAAYDRHGFVPTSSSFELERPAHAALPAAAPPDGVQLRPFDRNAHAAAVHTLIYRFWTEVPTHRHRDLAQWDELFLGYAGFDPDLQVVAWRGDAPVGAALCRVYGDAGWVLQLGVAPEERGGGLGRALLVEASRRLAAVAGVDWVGLSVVARNSNALGLYRATGFEVTREWLTCER